VARTAGLHFGVKLSNTLEVENERTVFDEKEKMMYLSGRALHAITVNLADKLWREFDGTLPMSFSAGADCFNAAELLACGMQTVTTCSDLLKTGGYLRFLQYIENTRDALAARAVHEQEDAGARLRQYARQVVGQQRLQKSAFQTSRSKTERELGLFDCIEAPCVDRCAIDQDVPGYMRAVADGDAQLAAKTTLADNPVPCILGRVCDHLCESTCIRTHLDEPLAIREIKRFIMEQEVVDETTVAPGEGPRVAIIGAGPGGMAAALKLAEGGARVEVYEQHPYAGGMVGGAIPEYRLPNETFNRDLERLERLGVHVHYNMTAGRDIRLSELRANGFEYIVIMAGAQLGKKLGLDGEDCDGVMDALYFLRHAREGRPVATGKRTGIIGAGDTAMDCARTAWRLSEDAEVSVIYRRTIDQMPADREEIALLQQEGIGIEELAKPVRLLIEDGHLAGLVCRRMEYRGERDASGRKVPFEVPGSDFEIPLDTLILAISQHAVLDFFDDEPIETNRWGYIVADPVSFETSSPGVYAGGDVVNDGPSSIVEAVADAKAIARAILAQDDEPAPMLATRDVNDLILKRARRQWREPVPHTDLDARRNFDEVVLGFDEQQARAEAARCLDCDRYCSICVGVCPNLALQTWRMQPVERQLPVLGAESGGIQVAGHVPWRITQGFQIAVLTDFCNECGNCTTFCPTSGEPYRDKPRLYLERAEFEAQRDNAFMVSRLDGWVMEGRWAGETHRIELNGALHYRTHRFAATLDEDDFSIRHIEVIADLGDDEALSLEPCAVMYALLTGLRDSMPYLPTALPAEAAVAGKIAHPGYAE
jgi:putative selenate reductase